MLFLIYVVTKEPNTNYKLRKAEETHIQKVKRKQGQFIVQAVIRFKCNRAKYFAITFLLNTIRILMTQKVPK
jgi:hypothetical protein